MDKKLHKWTIDHLVLSQTHEMITKDIVNQIFSVL